MIGNPHFRYRWPAVAILVLALAASAVAAESDAKTVRAGETQVLVTGTDKIAITAQPSRGVAKLDELPGPPVSYTLSYTAPKTESAFTEIIEYTDPTKKIFTVTVTPPEGELYNQAFKDLFVLFVVALLLESALAVVFNWRPWLVFVDGRGMKTVVSGIAAFILVKKYELNIVTRLINVYTQRDPQFDASLIDYILTALILAGGSAAVNNILVALGFRSVRTAAQVTPKPPKTVGWISVALDRDKAVGPVDVLIGDPASGPPVAGTIAGGKRLSRFVRLFIRDPNRFPMSGGFAVPAGTTCSVVLQGVDDNAQRISVTWGPKTIAAGAIIDLELKL